MRPHRNQGRENRLERICNHLSVEENARAAGNFRMRICLGAAGTRSVVQPALSVRFGLYILGRVLPGADVRGCNKRECSRGRNKAGPEGQAVTYTTAAPFKTGMPRRRRVWAGDRVRLFSSVDGRKPLPAFPLEETVRAVNKCEPGISVYDEIPHFVQRQGRVSKQRSKSRRKALGGGGGRERSSRTGSVIIEVTLPALIITDWSVWRSRRESRF